MQLSWESHCFWSHGLATGDEGGIETAMLRLLEQQHPVAINCSEQRCKNFPAGQTPKVTTDEGRQTPLPGQSGQYFWAFVEAEMVQGIVKIEFLNDLKIFFMKKLTKNEY